MKWTTIRLPGHGTHAAIPDGLFRQVRIEDAAGRWVAPDMAEVNLWNEVIMQDASLGSILKRQIAFVEMLTRSETGNGLILVDGYDADWRVLRRMKEGKSGTLHGLEFRYPLILDPKYAAIAAEICASLAGE